MKTTLIRLWYLFKQLLPLKYTSRYRDATGNMYIATWRQWFGHVFNYKVLGIKEKRFIAFLIDHKYIYRDKKGRLTPYADKNDGLFELKECYNEKTDWRGIQTLVTPKGRETFRLLCVGM